MSTSEQLVRVAGIVLGKRSTPKQRAKMKKYNKKNKRKLSKKKKLLRKKGKSRMDRPGGVSGKRRKKY